MVNIPSLPTAASLALLFSLTPPAQAEVYKFEVLPALGSPTGSLSIADNNWVAGSSSVSGASVATVWKKKTPLNYQPDGFTSTEALGLNAAGDVVGWGKMDNKLYALHWRHGKYHTLPALPGSPYPLMATVVNDAGQIAGVSGDHAVLWSGDTVTPLDGSGTGSMGTPTGINAAGTVVGNMFVHPSGFGATKWAGGQTVRLHLSGLYSNAKGINDADRTVGCSNLSDDTLTMHAARWDGTAGTVLADLSPSLYSSSCANAINNADVIVGYSAGVAARWIGDTVVDLNQLLTQAVRSQGWQLDEATGINDAGIIVGRGHNTVTGESVFYKLTPKQ